MTTCIVQACDLGDLRFAAQSRCGQDMLQLESRCTSAVGACCRLHMLLPRSAALSNGKPLNAACSSTCWMTCTDHMT